MYFNRKTICKKSFNIDVKIYTIQMGKGDTKVKGLSWMNMDDKNRVSLERAKELKSRIEDYIKIKDGNYQIE